jgi:chondroitin AC lyase
VDPVNQSYAYVVIPGISKGEMINRKTSAIKIVANTSLIQAVVHTNLQMMQVVFYEAGSLTYGGNSVSVDQPCVLLVKAMESKNPTVYVSDPTQTLTDVNVSFNAVSASLTFPQGAHKGATTAFQFFKR